ncbi:MAG: hypothetical protein ABIF82_00750 [Planctomycetota bacterium]
MTISERPEDFYPADRPFTEADCRDLMAGRVPDWLAEAAAAPLRTVVIGGQAYDVMFDWAAHEERPCDECGRTTWGPGPCFYCRQAAKLEARG